MRKPYNILVLCTGNSARSIIGEALFNTMGAGRFKAYSAGSHPTGKVNPFAIGLVQELGYPVENLRSKSWDEFCRPGAPELDFVVTVCDKAGRRDVPIVAGQPVTAHWAFPIRGRRRHGRGEALGLRRHTAPDAESCAAFPQPAAGDAGPAGHREPDARDRQRTAITA